ncbi:Transposon TX1 uncharacterized 149 kDa protein [Linum grandiflorum]
MWMEHENFCPMLQDWWGHDTSSAGHLFRIARKFKSLKGKLKQWNKDVFKCVERAIEASLLVIEALDGKEEEEGFLVEEERLLRMRTKCELDKLWKMEEISWKQKAKEGWLQLGDKNTKFFHRVANFKRRQTHLDGILVDGVAVVGQRDVATAAVNFYSQLYSESCVVRPFAPGIIGASISSREADSLVHSVGESEIWEALRTCAGDKSPRPDGFSMAFFKNNWNIVKDDVCNAVSEFFATSTLPLSINSTFVVLIPKKDAVSNFKDLRPISLVGGLYKIISKVMMRRLKPLLGGIISPQHCAFVENRQILDAVLIANEVIDSRIKSGKPGIVLKLDIEKAYDHLNWMCLFKVMERMGFPSRWVEWVKCCVSTASFSILVNGEASGYFRSSRGLRQGDPLSPFLFIFMMEVLSGILGIVQQDHMVSGFYMNERVQTGLVNHIMYADDALLFCDAEEDQVRFLVAALVCFETITGLRSLICTSQLSSLLGRFLMLVGWLVSLGVSWILFQLLILVFLWVPKEMIVPFGILYFKMWRPSWSPRNPSSYLLVVE